MRHLAKWTLCGLSLAAILAVSVAFAARSGGPTHNDFGRDYSKENGFSFMPPKGWFKMASTPAGTFASYTDPKSPEGFVTNMNVSVAPADKASIDTAVAEAKKAMAAAYKDYKSVQSGSFTINGRKVANVSGQFTMGGSAVQNMQYFIEGGSKKIYSMTFTSLQTAFEANRTIFETCALTALAD
jgi:hypothetical protein